MTWLLVVSLLSVTLCQAALPGDEHWDPQFNLPGTTNTIFGITTHNGNLYTGGYKNGGILTNVALNIWDGLQWTTLGNFSSPGSAVIEDIAFVGNSLYVAGTFTSVNGTAATGLAKWDGTAWSSVGIYGSVISLAVDGNNLYAAGPFTNVTSGGVVVTNIGYWDGSAWNALGGGAGNFPGFNYPAAVVVKSGSVYVGGAFTNCGSFAVTNIAVWSGSNWMDIGGANSSVGALAFNGNDLYVGGSFTQAGNAAAKLVAKWDGLTWSALGAGLSGSQVSSLAVFNGAVYAGGTFTAGLATNIAVWNSSIWSPVGTGVSASVYRVFNNGTNLYVGGNFLAAGGMLADAIASWDGANWSVIGIAGHMNGLANSAHALTGDGTNLYAAGGSLNWAGQTNLNLIARFDGTNWFPLGSGITGSGVISGPVGTTILTLVLAGNNLYAGGYFTNAGGLAAPDIAMWNGTNWSALGSPGGVVASILVRTDGVYAAGAPFYNTTMYGSAFFSRWNGTSWQGVPINYPPFTDTAFYFADKSIDMDALASIGTNIYIGGRFSIGEYSNFPSGYVGCDNIMRFDGTNGWVMGTGLNSNVTSMAVLGTNLYVAGPFTNAGGVLARGIAMWNGTYWTNLGSGLVGSGSIAALATIGSNLYAGGTFTNMGGVSANRVAKWDGTNWSALGGGISTPALQSAPVTGLVASGSDLYVCGVFQQAGDKASVNIARWNDQVNFDTPQLLKAAMPGNGLFGCRLNGQYGLTNIIQATTNFATWTPIFTNTTGIFNFIDTNTPGTPYRFYRAVLGP